MTEVCGDGRVPVLVIFKENFIHGTDAKLNTAGLFFVTSLNV